MRDYVINRKVPKIKQLKKNPLYIIELPFIFYSCHANKLSHNSIIRSKENLKESEYYYEDITKDLMEYISTVLSVKQIKLQKKLRQL